MRYQYAAGRLQLPFSAEKVEVLNDAMTLESRLLYLAIAGANTAGVNLLSDIVGPILINAGQSLQITFDSDMRLDGEFWDSFVLAASATDDVETFVQLARLNLRTEAGEAEILPLTLILDRDSDFVLSGAIATPSQLPPYPVQGMLRAIASLSGKIFEYDETFARPANDTTILAAAVGRWRFKPGNYSAYLENTLDGGGCNRPISLVAATDIRAPRYQPSGASGVKRILWLNNTLSSPVQAGLRVGFTVELDGVAQGDAFSGLLQTRFLGYANSLTGALRKKYANGEDFPFVGMERAYQNRKTDLLLVDELQPNEAYAVEIYPRLLGPQIAGGLTQNSLIRVSPFLFSQQGSFAQIGEALGDWIYPTHERGWVIPQEGLQAIALKRSGMVQNYEFLMVGPTEVVGLHPDTAGQLIAVNGNGAIYRRPTVLDENERLRAIVSTEAGISAASDWSEPLLLGTGNGLRVTCNYPSNGTTAVIRGDYPDAIAGMVGQAKFNPPLVGIFVQSGSEIRVFDGLAVLDGAQQVFDLTSWADGEVISSVPPATSENFCLFKPLSATAVALGGGDFPEGLIQVAFAFEFDGSAISSISHAEEIGCIHVAAMTLAEIERNSQAWAATVLTSQVASLPRLPTTPMQTRRTLGGMPIVFDPSSMRPADNTYTWKPTYLGATDPGRWEADWYQDFVGLPFSELPPPTQAREIIIFADTNGILRQRMPNNGGVLALAGGGAGGDIPVVPDVLELQGRGAEPYRFIFLVEHLSLYFFNPLSRWDEDGFSVIRPVFIPIDEDGRWEAYPNTLKRMGVQAAITLDVEVLYLKVIEPTITMDIDVSIFEPVEVLTLLPFNVEIEQIPATSEQASISILVETAIAVLVSISSWLLDTSSWIDSIGGHHFVSAGTVDVVSGSARLSHISGAGTLTTPVDSALVAPMGFVFSLDFYTEDVTAPILLARKVSSSDATQKEWELTYNPFIGDGRLEFVAFHSFSGEIFTYASIVMDRTLAINTWHSLSIELNPSQMVAILNSESFAAFYGSTYSPVLLLDKPDSQIILGDTAATNSDFRVKNVSFSKYN